MLSRNMTKQPSTREIVLFGFLFLIFFQLLSDFIEAIYAFGLLGTSIPPEIAAVLFLFTPLLLTLIPKGLSNRSLASLGELVLLCRAAEAALDTRGRMLASGLGVGLFLIFFPALLWRTGQREEPSRAFSLGAGLTLGVSLSIFLRAIYSGLDLSTDRSFQWIGWILVGAAAILLPGAVGVGTRTTRSGLRREPRAPEGQGNTASQPVILPALGITSIFILLFFAFTAPNVIARWTGSSYLLNLTTLGAALAIFAILLASGAVLQGALASGLTHKLVWVWNLLFVISLVLTILAHQVRFPIDPGNYPLEEAKVSPLTLIPLAAMLVLSPVLLWDFTYLVYRLTSTPLSMRALGGGFSLASLYLLFVIFTQVFTTVYDYIPVAGPFFRDKFWLAFLIPGVVLLLSVTWSVAPGSPPPAKRNDASRKQAAGDREPLRNGPETRPVFRLPWSFAAAVGLAALASLAGALLNSPRPAPQPEENHLKVLTYNIQQGYSADGQRSYAGQLELMRQVNPDLIGLQESDTNRIANGNADLVRYFADRLDMVSYYGPKTVTGTFGIALLSKLPIRNARTFFMYSSGEQTATIAAQIERAGRTFNVYVTHLGNGGPLIQQQQLLEDIDEKSSVIAMGDFNFEPDTEQYRLTTALLADAWLSKWPQGADDRGYQPTHRIDHIFTSPGTIIQDARHLTGPQSDHPAVWVEVTW